MHRPVCLQALILIIYLHFFICRFLYTRGLTVTVHCNSTIHMYSISIIHICMKVCGIYTCTLLLEWKTDRGWIVQSKPSAAQSKLPPFCFSNKKHRVSCDFEAHLVWNQTNGSHLLTCKIILNLSSTPKPHTTCMIVSLVPDDRGFFFFTLSAQG